MNMENTQESENKEESTSLPPNITIRYTDLSDGRYLKEWLMNPEVGRWFPMYDQVEIDDAVNRWIGFSRYKCSLTALKDGVPVGMVTLYLQPYRKLAHQCEFGIIMSPHHRGQGIGTLLIKNAMHLAKSNFRIELLHLIVNAENPAMRLYSRMGFIEFGRQEHWMKEESENGPRYVSRVFMQRFL